jgi:hypothetical protein
MNKGNGKETLKPGKHSARTILVFSEAPHPIMLPPKTEYKKGDQTNQKDEKAHHNGHKYFHYIDFLGCPEDPI